MFKDNHLLFLYAITPVHMGAGEAVGVIDNPIQRECHTCHPNIAGSGLKGSLRHFATSTWDRSLVNRLFGPDSTSDNMHAGAISFGDAQIIAFPVRSLKQGFVYAVSSTSLARLRRLGQVAENANFGWNIPLIKDDEAKVCSTRILSGDKLILESFQFRGNEDEDTKQVANWLANNALPNNEENKYFADKIRQDLVLLPDQAFSYFAEHSTAVESHVRIDEEKGVARSGGLFYTENLPPESLMVAPVFCSDERYRNGNKAENIMQSEEIIEKLKTGFNDRLLQIGGNSTTGRGQVLLHFMERDS